MIRQCCWPGCTVDDWLIQIGDDVGAWFCLQHYDKSELRSGAVAACAKCGTQTSLWKGAVPLHRRCEAEHEDYGRQSKPKVGAYARKNAAPG